jgi:5'(3')-deoxyribonucleotidase
MTKEKLYKIADSCSKVYLDCDGVLTASNEAMCILLNKKYNKSHKGCEVLDWNYTNLYPTCANEIEALFETTEMFRHLKLIKGAKNFLAKYRKKIIIVTKGGVNNYIYKRQLFDNEGFVDIPIIRLPLDISKSVINMDGGLFIDDCTCNLNESNATYKLMFMEYNDGNEREWQLGWDGERIYEW